MDLRRVRKPPACTLAHISPVRCRGTFLRTQSSMIRSTSGMSGGSLGRSREKREQKYGFAVPTEMGVILRLLRLELHRRLRQSNTRKAQRLA